MSHFLARTLRHTHTQSRPPSPQHERAHSFCLGGATRVYKAKGEWPPAGTVSGDRPAGKPAHVISTVTRLTFHPSPAGQMSRGLKDRERRPPRTAWGLRCGDAFSGGTQGPSGTVLFLKWVSHQIDIFRKNKNLSSFKLNLKHKNDCVPPNSDFSFFFVQAIKLKLFSYLDQNASLYWKNCQVVTYTIISATWEWRHNIK